MLNFISDELLIEAYVKAVTLDYNSQFISLLEEEIKLRGINIEKVLRHSTYGY